MADFHSSVVINCPPNNSNPGQRRTKVKALIKYRLKITLVQGPDPSGRGRYADPPPLICHWQLVLQYFRC